MIRSTLIVVIGFAWSVTLVRGAPGLASELAAETADNAKPQSLYLHTEFLPYEKPVEKGLPHRLGREIVRQAILIAARDGLELATSDETLKETASNRAGVTHLMVQERADRDGHWNVKLIPYAAESPTWEKTYDFVAKAESIYADMIPKLAADSRGEFLDALKKAGLRGDKPQLRDPQLPSEEIEKLLGKVDFIAQFGAVRCCQKSLAAATTLTTTSLLANLCLEQNDWENWEKTLLAFLETESLGLEHSQVQGQLAYGYASRGQWFKAKPFATAAAAEKYWRRSVVAPTSFVVFKTLAGMELAKRHGTSRGDDDILDEKDVWPPLPAQKSGQ